MAYVRNSQPLHDLLSACDRADTDFLLKYTEEHREKSDYAAVDNSNCGPLHYAVYRDSYECVKILLSTNLVNIALRSNEIPSDVNSWKYSTCLDIAIDRQVSTELIQLLLHNDPEYELLGRNMLPLRIAVLNNSLRMVEAIIDTLFDMQFVCPKGVFQEYLFAHVVETYNLRIYTPQQKLEAFKIFERLIYFVTNESKSEFLERVAEELVRCPTDFLDYFFGKYTEQWFYAETNKHRHLARKLLENPGLGFDRYVVLGLHLVNFSQRNVDRYDIRGQPYTFYEHVMNCMLKVDIANHEIIKEVTTVLWPKLSKKKLGDAYCRAVFDNAKTQEECGKVTSIKWLDQTNIGIKVDIDTMELDNVSEVKTMMRALLPFSTKTTGDDYLTTIRKKMNSNEERRKELHKLDNDTEMSSFCVSGKYRAKNSLQGLCRASIRKTLQRPKYVKNTHKQFIQSIRSLGLPKTVERFLMFNDSDYNL